MPKGDHDIVAYFFNDGLPEGNTPGTVGGSYIASNLSMIVASNHTTVTRTEAQVLRTLAHGIWHCLIDNGTQDGHPDEATGVAPLPGTDATWRLMCSGFKRRDDGVLLVKAEWDAAEQWLKSVPDKRMFDNTGSVPDSY